MQISSITIAKNEAANIARCVKSLFLCADEVIVLIDSSTTDATIEIVKSFPGVRYEVVQWQGYAKTKEYAVSLSTHDWILWLDADEEISPPLVKELKQWKEKTKADAEIYSFPRIAEFLGRWIRHSGWYPGRVSRLFNKQSVKFSSAEVHESLLSSGTAGKFTADILHYTDPNIKHYYDKFNNYTSLAAVELVRQKKNFSIAGLIIRPPFLFFKMYIMKLGFLDGLQGLMLAVFSANYVFTKYAKFWEAKNMEDSE